MMQHNINKVIGNNLQNIRLVNKLTYDQFAEKLDISPQHLRKLEKGRNTPNAEIIARACITFEVSADKLLGVKDVN